MNPNVLIVRTAGTNCDQELAHAFALAGATPQTLHVNDLIADPRQIERFDLIGFPGGFSYGDDIAAGRIFANRLKHRLYEPLAQAVARGVPILGICNGFQVLIKLGLLPNSHAGRQTATLADNLNGRFIDRWTPMHAQPNTVCLWTKGLSDFDLPIAHGEGRFLAPDDVVETLEKRGQIALRYAKNPNGSVADIAGVCDPTGVVLGLMPHPERFVDPTHHPQWTRQGDAFLSQSTPGLAFFKNAVSHVIQKPSQSQSSQ